MRLRSFLLLTNRPYFATFMMKPQKLSKNTNQSNALKVKQVNYSRLTKTIIAELSKNKIDLDHTINLLYKLFKEYEKSPYNTPDDFLQLINILSIIQSKNQQKLKWHKINVIQSINKFFNVVEIDAECLQNYMKAQKEYRAAIKQKTKSNSILFNLLITVEYNINKLYPKYYVYIFELLLNDVHQTAKFKKIADKLLLICTPIFKKQQRYDGDMGQLLQKVSQIYKIYGVSNTQGFQAFYQYLTKTFIAIKKLSKIKENDLKNLSVIYMNFNHQIKDSSGRRYKTLLAEQLNDFFSINQFKISKYQYKYCSAILNYNFYLHSTSLPIIQQGSIFFLPKNLLGPRPQLPQFFWKIYRSNPQLLNYVNYMKCIIKDIYPESFISTSNNSVKTIPPFLDTEMKIRVEQACILLGIKYQSEVEISGRYIDFLLDENIVLEVDGTFHIDINKLEIDDVTHSRNIHLIYAGYRLVSINIYQYNLAREISELKELISIKLQFLKENDCVLVI